MPSAHENEVIRMKKIIQQLHLQLRKVYDEKLEIKEDVEKRVFSEKAKMETRLIEKIETVIDLENLRKTRVEIGKIINDDATGILSSNICKNCKRCLFEHIGRTYENSFVKNYKMKKEIEVMLNERFCSDECKREFLILF